MAAIIPVPRPSTQANSAAGDHAGTGGSGLHQHAAGAELADRLVRNGGTIKGNGDHVLLGSLEALADRLGDFSGLAKAVTDLALAVANDHQSRELGHAAALHGLGNTVEENELFHVFALFAFKSRHCIFLLP